MNNHKAILQDIINSSGSKNLPYKRTLIKEYLQVLVLDFIYSHPEYDHLIFYGGSCLSQCYGLPRLSEDLDFVDLKKEVNLPQLAKDLSAFFKKETDLAVIATTQKFRAYLKFPLLFELGLARKGESDLIFLKIEVFNKFDFGKNYKIETIPLFKTNRSLLVKTFDLPTLMATKIRAIFHRKWEKTNKKGEAIIKAKGRDYFDLMWYLDKKVSPNLDCIEGIKDKEDLRIRLIKIIEKIDPASIRLDLEAFIADQAYLANLSRSLKDILLREIGQI
jgi:predicted nucleotidyltransferase component of viral defense system